MKSERLKIAVIDPDRVIFDGTVSDLKGIGEVMIVRERLTQEEFETAAAEANVVVNNGSHRLTGEFLSSSQQVRLVVSAGTGTDWIDKKAAGERGILICNSPAYAVEAVAERTLMLMLALAQKFPQVMHAVADGDWPAHVRGDTLSGKTIGVVGLGKIGGRVAQLANGIGMEVAGLSRTKRDIIGVRQVGDLETLLRESHFLSLHLPLTVETERIMSEARFGQMREGGFLVNTARGRLVDEEALLAGLNCGLLAGAGLDVLAVEPPPADHPLLHHPKVIVSGHSAANSRRALENLNSDIVKNIEGWLAGNQINVVT